MLRILYFLFFGYERHKHNFGQWEFHEEFICEVEGLTKIVQKRKCLDVTCQYVQYKKQIV